MTGGPTGRLATLAVAVLVVAPSLLAGCTAPAGGSARPGSSTQPGRALVPRAGGTVTVAVDSVPATLNDHTPAGDTAMTRALSSMVWAQVFQVAPGVTPKLDTDVVQSAEVVNVDPQTVVYQIDRRAVWSDGIPVSAQDFVYAWLSQAGPGRDVDGSLDSVASTAGYRDIASVTGSNGGQTVTVVFQTPFADWTSLFADLLPAHVAERVGWNHGFDRYAPAALLSAGPFMVTSWTPGRQIVLGRNPHWWGAPAVLDGVVLQAVPGAKAMADALRSGAAQVAYPSAFDARFEAEVSSAPALESSTSLGTTSLQLVFNVHHAPLDVAEVRQGIAHAIDRASLVTSFIQPVAPLVWEDNDHLFANSERWYVDDAHGYVEHDPAAAARLLVTGGLVADAEGAWTWRGVPAALRFVWASDDPWSAAVAPAVAAQLVTAGFEVSSVPTSAANLLGTVLPSAAFDVALAPFSTGAYPSTMAGFFGSAPDGPLSVASDWSGFDDPRIDMLFVRAAQELAADQDQQLYQQIDASLWEAMPTLPLFVEPTVLTWSISLTSVRDDPGGLGPMWGVGRWAELLPAPRKSALGAREGVRASR